MMVGHVAALDADFFGLFDGHAGDVVANAAREMFPLELEVSMASRYLSRCFGSRLTSEVMASRAWVRMAQQQAMLYETRMST
jgi:serine/threonine protein phosphatase PrpC